MYMNDKDLIQFEAYALMLFLVLCLQFKKTWKIILFGISIQTQILQIASHY